MENESDVTITDKQFEDILEHEVRVACPPLRRMGRALSP